MEQAMAIDPKGSARVYKICYWGFGLLAVVGLVGYAVTYLVVMPQISPDGFVPKTQAVSTPTTFGFGHTLALFVLFYAFAFLPVLILFTIRKYQTSPHALVAACCLMATSLLLEIINNLPHVAMGLFPGQLSPVSPEVLLYLQQVQTIHYLVFDVGGFTLAYMALFIYGLVYFKKLKVLSYACLASIVVFIANIPCLWFAPNAAIILMAVSIFAFAVVPVYLTKMALE